MTRFTKTLSAALLLSLTACAAEPAAESTEIGTLKLPIVTTAADGTQYALAGTFDIAGPQPRTLEHDVTDPALLGYAGLATSLRVGAYNVTLAPWALYQVDTSSSPPVLTPVTDATLINGATQAVNIARDENTFVVFEFAVPGSGPVVFATGGLALSFSVNAGLPDGASCNTDVECESHVCDDLEFRCSVPVCNDGVLNGGETSPDVGPSCWSGSDACATTGCPDGQVCQFDYVSGTDLCVDPVSVGCDPAMPSTCPTVGEFCTLSSEGAYFCKRTACDDTHGCGLGESCLTVFATGERVCAISLSGPPCSMSDTTNCQSSEHCVDFGTGISVCLDQAITTCSSAQLASCDPDTSNVCAVIAGQRRCLSFVTAP